MPLYDYSCPDCGANKEVEHSMNEVGKIEVLCDVCSSIMKKNLSMPSLVGFDDVGRSGRLKEKDGKTESKTESAKDDSKVEPAAKKESKPATTSKAEKSA